MASDKYEKYKQYENNILDDRYIIDKLIGVGGMAVVFRARDTYLNNMTVAIKILKDDAATDEIVVKRFKELCDARNIKLNELANISGVTPSTAYSMMDGKRRDVSIITIKKFCDGLGISLGEFFSTPDFDSLEQEIE